MRLYNFYVNIDQCISLANYDMFFYGMKSDNRIQIMDVETADENKNIDAAIREIHSRIDESPFLIQNYRIVFGMRMQNTEQTRWEETILYRLLKIHYALRHERMILRSDDRVDRNVSVIILHDVDSMVDVITNQTYDAGEDIEKMLASLGLNKKGSTDRITISNYLREYVVQAEKYMIEHEQENNSLPDADAPDELTVEFLKDYLYSDYGDMERWQRLLERDQNVHKDAAAYVQDSKNGAYISFLYHLRQYVSECIGTYCVFRKSIVKLNPTHMLLGELSIVEYINSDPYRIPADVTATIDSRCVRLWEQVSQDETLKQTYSHMLERYYNNLTRTIYGMEKQDRNGTAVFKIEEKIKVIKGDERFNDEDKADFNENLSVDLNNFVGMSYNPEKAMKKWQETYEQIQNTLKNLQSDVETYTEQLSEMYQHEILSRKKKDTVREKRDDYTMLSLFTELNHQKRRRQEILAELKKPQMTAELEYQDQLAIQNKLEKSGKEIELYINCLESVRSSNFMAFVLVGFGLVLLHYVLMQNYFFTNSLTIVEVAVYILAAILIGIPIGAKAPGKYFQKKIRACTDQLYKELEVYISSYFKKANDFRTYINLLNELDIVTGHIRRIEKMEEESIMRSKKMLWHIMQMRKHQERCVYFNNLFRMDQSEKEYLMSDDYIHVNIEKDVVHNPLYWPQNKESV